MKKISKLLAATAMFFVLMICLTSVSFAGTSKDKVTVKYLCSNPETLEVSYDDLVVKGDLVEKYFPDFAKYEPTKKKTADTGVSYLDAVVAANIKRYGVSELTSKMSLVDQTTFAWIASAFGQSVVAAIDNNVAISSVHNQIKDGDLLVTLIHSPDRDWHTLLYAAFDKPAYTVTVGKPLTVTVKGMSIMSSKLFDLDTAKLYDLDLAAGKMNEIEAAAPNKGLFTVSYNKAGTYYLTADSYTTYSDEHGTYDNSRVYGGFAKVTVKDVVPAKPVISAKRTAKTKAVVTWKKAKNAKKYEVAYRMKGKTKWTIKRTTSTKITLTKLKAKKAYQVKVRSINGTSASAYSSVKTIKAK